MKLIGDTLHVKMDSVRNRLTIEFPDNELIEVELNKRKRPVVTYVHGRTKCFIYTAEKNGLKEFVP